MDDWRIYVDLCPDGDLRHQRSLPGEVRRLGATPRFAPLGRNGLWLSSRPRETSTLRELPGGITMLVIFTGDRFMRSMFSTNCCEKAETFYLTGRAYLDFADSIGHTSADFFL